MVTYAAGAVQVLGHTPGLSTEGPWLANPVVTPGPCVARVDTPAYTPTPEPQTAGSAEGAVTNAGPTTVGTCYTGGECEPTNINMFRISPLANTTYYTLTINRPGRLTTIGADTVGPGPGRIFYGPELDDNKAVIPRPTVPGPVPEGVTPLTEPQHSANAYNGAITTAGAVVTPPTAPSDGHRPGGRLASGKGPRTGGTDIATDVVDYGTILLPALQTGK